MCPNLRLTTSARATAPPPGAAPPGGTDRAAGGGIDRVRDLADPGDLSRWLVERLPRRPVGVRRPGQHGARQRSAGGDAGAHGRGDGGAVRLRDPGRDRAGPVRRPPARARVHQRAGQQPRVQPAAQGRRAVLGAGQPQPHQGRRRQPRRLAAPGHRVQPAAASDRHPATPRGTAGRGPAHRQDRQLGMGRRQRRRLLVRRALPHLRPRPRHGLRAELPGVPRPDAPRRPGRRRGRRQPAPSRRPTSSSSTPGSSGRTDRWRGSAAGAALPGTRPARWHGWAARRRTSPRPRTPSRRWPCSPRWRPRPTRRRPWPR